MASIRERVTFIEDLQWVECRQRGKSRLVSRRALPYLSNRLSPVLPHSWIGWTTVVPNTTVQLAEQVSQTFIASLPTLPVGLKESPHGIECHQFVQCWRNVASPRWSFSHMTSLALRMNVRNGECGEELCTALLGRFQPNVQPFKITVQRT